MAEDEQEGIVPVQGAIEMPSNPPRNQVLLILFALFTSNLFALLVTFIFEFLSLRGVVHLAASRVILACAWASGVVIIVAWAFGTKIKAKQLTVVGGSLLLAVSMLTLDLWAPKPDPLSAPATQDGVASLFDRYFGRSVPTSTTTIPNPPDGPEQGNEHYAERAYLFLSLSKVRGVYVSNESSSTTDPPSPHTGHYGVAIDCDVTLRNTGQTPGSDISLEFEHNAATVVTVDSDMPASIGRDDSFTFPVTIWTTWGGANDVLTHLYCDGCYIDANGALRYKTVFGQHRHEKVVVRVYVGSLPDQLRKYAIDRAKTLKDEEGK